jgi:hypothetical protein
MTTETDLVPISGVDKAIKVVGEVMELPADQHIDYLEMLALAATKYMRLLGGEEYTRGWLTAALADLDNPLQFVLKKHN